MIELRHKEDCCGCTACASVCGRGAISMVRDAEGFLYPRVEAGDCVGCGLCETVCPVQRYDHRGPRQHPPQVYALHHRDEEIWEKSSSGGVFAALCEAVLAEGGCVFGAAYNERWEVVHRRADTQETADAFRGSKYVQSDLQGVYAQVKAALSKGRKVLFSGTPCQCEGLRGYLRREYDTLLIVDIMCHCVPSPALFADYVQFVQRKAGSPIRSIFMKDKRFGWGEQTLRITFENGEEWFNTPETRLWNTIFYSRLATRPSCHACRFTNYHHPGDVTIGDFWGIDRTHPEFYDRKGISLLFVNTAKGEALFAAVSKRFVYIKSDVEHCVQPNLLHPTQPAPARGAFWQDYARLSFRSLCVKYFGYGLRNYLRRRMKGVINKLFRR